jgi:hypothetical protein
MILQPHQQRVVDEHDSLDALLEKLHVFIEDSPIFKGLSKFDQRLLADQRVFMTAYRDVLRKRIERF